MTVNYAFIQTCALLRQGRLHLDHYQLQFHCGLGVDEQDGPDACDGDDGRDDGDDDGCWGEVFDMYDPEMNARECYVLTLYVFGVNDDAD